MLRIRRFSRLVVITLVLALVVAACSNDADSVVADRKDPADESARERQTASTVSTTTEGSVTTESSVTTEGSTTTEEESKPEPPDLPKQEITVEFDLPDSADKWLHDGTSLVGSGDETIVLETSISSYSPVALKAFGQDGEELTAVLLSGPCEVVSSEGPLLGLNGQPGDSCRFLVDAPATEDYRQTEVLIELKYRLAFVFNTRLTPDPKPTEPLTVGETVTVTIDLTPDSSPKLFPLLIFSCGVASCQEREIDERTREVKMVVPKEACPSGLTFRADFTAGGPYLFSAKDYQKSLDWDVKCP